MKITIKTISMFSSKFEIKKESDESPKMVKMDHPGMQCFGFDCDKGWVQFFRKPDMPISPGSVFLLCSNSRFGCNQKMYIAYGSTTCMECNKIIAQVVITLNINFIL